MQGIVVLVMLQIPRFSKFRLAIFVHTRTHFKCIQRNLGLNNDNSTVICRYSPASTYKKIFYVLVYKSYCINSFLKLHSILISATQYLLCESFFSHFRRWFISVYCVHKFVIFMEKAYRFTLSFENNLLLAFVFHKFLFTKLYVFDVRIFLNESFTHTHIL